MSATISSRPISDGAISGDDESTRGHTSAKRARRRVYRPVVEVLPEPEPEPIPEPIPTPKYDALSPEGQAKVDRLILEMKELRAQFVAQKQEVV